MESHKEELARLTALLAAPFLAGQNAEILGDAGNAVFDLARERAKRLLQPEEADVYPYQLFLPGEVMTGQSIEKRFAEVQWPGFGLTTVKRLVKDAHELLPDLLSRKLQALAQFESGSESKFYHQFVEAAQDVVARFTGTRFGSRARYAMMQARVWASLGDENNPGAICHTADGYSQAIDLFHWNGFHIDGQCSFCKPRRPNKIESRPYYVFLIASQELGMANKTKTLPKDAARSEPADWYRTIGNLYFPQGGWQQFQDFHARCQTARERRPEKSRRSSRGVIAREAKQVLRE